MRIFSLLLPFLLLGACTEEDLAHAHDAEVNPSEVTTHDGLYTIHLTPSSDPYGAGSVVGLDMHLTANEADVTGATLTLTPFMPDMGHGIESDPVVTEGEMGMYAAAWTFSMAGLWEVDIDVDGSEGADMVTVSYEVE